jgi:hypothetical protein
MVGYEMALVHDKRKAIELAFLARRSGRREKLLQTSRN